MFARPVKSYLVLILLALAGCATVPERDLVLENARVAVSSARSDPQVISYAPEELRQAVVTLGQADDLALHGGSASEVDRLALAANQRAEFAQRIARTRSAEAALAAQQTANTAQLQADLSRRQAEAAQMQAAAAQRQAEEAQRRAAAIQLQTLPAVASPPTEAGIAPQRIADLPVLPSARGLVITLNDAMFYPRSADLEPRGQYTVQRLATFLTTHPERTVAIEGFADTNDYADRNLSERRARAVQEALVNLGVDSRRTVARGYGREYPVASNDTPAGREMNRRVEVVISDRGGIVVPRG